MNDFSKLKLDKELIFTDDSSNVRMPQAFEDPEDPEGAWINGDFITNEELQAVAEWLEERRKNPPVKPKPKSFKVTVIRDACVRYVAELEQSAEITSVEDLMSKVRKTGLDCPKDTQ